MSSEGWEKGEANCDTSEIDGRLVWGVQTHRQCLHLRLLPGSFLPLYKLTVGTLEGRRAVPTLNFQFYFMICSASSIYSTFCLKKIALIRHYYKRSNLANTDCSFSFGFLVSFYVLSTVFQFIQTVFEKGTYSLPQIVVFWVYNGWFGERMW